MSRSIIGFLCLVSLGQCVIVGAQKASARGQPAPLFQQTIPPMSSSSIVGSVPGGVTPAELDDIAGNPLRSLLRIEPTFPRVAPPLRIRVSREVAMSLLRKRVPPEYPMDARRTRIQGTVLLHVIISKQGDVTTMKVISGEPMLAPAAIEAARQWKYNPYLLSGQPIEVDTQVQVSFLLSTVLLK